MAERLKAVIVEPSDVLADVCGKILEGINKLAASGKELTYQQDLDPLKFRQYFQAIELLGDGLALPLSRGNNSPVLASPTSSEILQIAQPTLASPESPSLKPSPIDQPTPASLPEPLSPQPRPSPEASVVPVAAKEVEIPEGYTTIALFCEQHDLDKDQKRTITQKVSYEARHKGATRRKIPSHDLLYSEEYLDQVVRQKGLISVPGKKKV